MIVIDQWDARRACLLQSAYRHTNESFARDLGIAVRTVAAWHERPDTIPRTEIQQILDTALEKATPPVVARFERLLAADKPATGEAQALTVAIAVVVRDGHVLLVCRRSESHTDLSWQFPAGVIKPGAALEAVAVRETLAETGIHSAVRAHIGRRVHPVTGVLCEYVLCDYLTGEARNADAMENLDVAWAPIGSLSRFIPTESIFPPVLEALEGRHDRDIA
jgi:8-oxo-dGTP diphosphatase